jgi:hypothetical protein
MEITEQVTFEELQADKAHMRAEDAEAIRTGVKTPMQVQEENSLFPMNAKVRYDLAAYLRRAYSE